MSQSLSLSRPFAPARSNRPLLCALLVASVVLIPRPGRSQPTQGNLVVNGTFRSDLNGWLEEDDEHLTSNWYRSDANGSPLSGSAWGGAKEQPFGVDTNGWVIGQCFAVTPGVHYFSVHGKFHPDNELGDAERRAHLQAVDWTGQSCSLAVPSTNLGSPNALASGSLRHDDWTQVTRTFTVQPGTNQLFVGMHMFVEEFGSGFEDQHVLADRIVVSRYAPDLRLTEFTIPDSAVAQLQEFDIEVGTNSLYNGEQPTIRIDHGGRLALVSASCPAGGTVSDVSSGGEHYFLWSGYTGSYSPYGASCTITARALVGSSGSAPLRATVDCAECAADHDPSNNEEEVTLTVTTDPDLATEIVLDDLPNQHETFAGTVHFTNHGNQLTVGRLELRSKFQDLQLEATDCFGLGASDGPTDAQNRRLFAEGDFLLNPGQTVSCELELSVAGGGTFEAWAIAASSSNGDYRPSNDENRYRTVSVLLRPTAPSVDTVDANPGDGLCRDSSNRCTLRAAVMEAMALDGNRKVLVPRSVQNYLLDATTGSSPSEYGSLLIDRRVVIEAEPGARGTSDPPPRIVAAFPAGAEDRIFHIEDGSFVRIEGVELVGQGVAPPTGDATGGHGGLVHHGSGELVLRDVVMRNGATDGHGGALYSDAGILGDLTLERVQVFDSSADSGAGGGIGFDPGGFATLTMIDSEIAGNSAANGGGLWVNGNLALLTIRSSSFHTNVAQLYGGGMYLSEAPGSSIENSTISTNDATLIGGGGIMVAAVQGGTSELLISNSTIAYNRAVPDDPDEGVGGGIYQGPNSTVELYNSILAYNVGGRRGSPPVFFPDGGNCFGTIDSEGYNSVTAVTTDNQCGFVANTGDHLDTFVSLAPLAYDGSTPLHALTADGNEVDAGDPVCLDHPGGDPLLVDQRGFPRPSDGDGDGTAACDKGAWEKPAGPDPNLIFLDGFESGDFSAWTSFTP
ncbi:MAG: right-handed parallel beta-helix repeat-containing protein [Acidobacteria bacterium]|nr:MAG: right-handed parallel beta-helix repeat-containing protein [Acidobacteriota bacterium]REK03274.1 MAG: right-handed parallel beta-helix repeat-containing protein [Acidobacteriota bacterium]